VEPGDGRRTACERCLELQEQLHDLRQMLAASGQYVAYSPGPNSNPTCDEELRRWLAVSTDADAVAGFRAGWTRLDRFVGPRLRDWEARCERARRDGPVSSVISPRSSPGSGSFSGSNQGRNVLAPYAAWQRLQDMREVVAHQPAIAHAIECLPLYDQLELTLELLRQVDWPEFNRPEPLPPNVIPFRARRQ
jgi:hypothetical protein